MTTYYATIKCQITGVTLIEDLECEIEAERDGYRLNITDVLVDGVSLFKGDPFTQALAAKIANQAEDDDRLHECFEVPAWDTAAQRRELGTY